MKKNVVIVAGAVAVVISVAALLLLQLMTRGRIDEPVSVDPAIEREIVEKDRAILRTKIAAVFPDWVEAWRSDDDRFDPAELQRDGLESIDSLLDIQEDEPHLPLDDEALRPLISPDGTKYIEYGGYSEEAEPDSELTLVDTLKKERRRLLFYGPSVRIDDAAWADNETVIAVGTEEAEAGPQKTAVRPLVWIFHLPQRLVSTYSPAPR
jgi:hypothetical protein